MYISVRFALRRYAASARVEVSVAEDLRSTTAIHSFVHCANPHSQPCLCSFSRSTEPITSFRYRLFADETKPELPLREAPGSLSIDLNLDHEPRELLSFARSHETSLSSLTAAPVTNCHSSRPNYTGTFQCHSTSERVNFRDRSSDGSDRGSRSSECLVMVVVLLFALLGRCVAQRSTGRRGFWGFGSRCASPRASRWSARPVR